MKNLHSSFLERSLVQSENVDNSKIKQNQFWRMLKGPMLIFSVLHLLVLQNRPQKGHKTYCNQNSNKNIEDKNFVYYNQQTGPPQAARWSKPRDKGTNKQWYHCRGWQMKGSLGISFFCQILLDDPFYKCLIFTEHP